MKKQKKQGRMHEEKNLCKQVDFIESVEIYPEKLDNGYMLKRK